jgi:hypothetical protein
MRAERQNTKSSTKIIITDGTTSNAIYEDFCKAISDERHDEARRLYKELVASGESSKEILNKLVASLYGTSIAEFDPSDMDRLSRNDKRTANKQAREKTPRNVTYDISVQRATSLKGIKEGAVTTETGDLSEKPTEPSIDALQHYSTRVVVTETKTELADRSHQLASAEATMNKDGASLILPEPAIFESNKDGTNPEDHGQSASMADVVPPLSRLHSLRRFVSLGSAPSVFLSGLVLSIVAGVLLFELHVPSDGLHLPDSQSTAAPAITKSALADASALDAATKAKEPPAKEATTSSEEATQPPAQIEVTPSIATSVTAPNEKPPGSTKEGQRQPEPSSPATPSAPDGEAEASSSIQGTDSGLSQAEVGALMQQGDALFALGDVASARLFYERAASAGNGQAALRLGNSFDSFFLNKVGMGRVHGDAGMAARWYSQALVLGETDAQILLNALENK